MSEEWRRVSWAPDYEVSNLGRVKSWKKPLSPIVMAPQKRDGRGSLGVTLRAYGLSHSSYISRLVAEAFIPNPDQLPEVAHENGDFTDNRVQNLRWSTHKDNMVDMVNHGRSNVGVKNPSAKLTPDLVREMRSRYVPRQVTYRQLADEYGVSLYGAYRAINTGWQHV